MPDVALSLTQQEFALVWQCLGKQPAEVVYALMKKLETQVTPPVAIKE